MESYSRVQLSSLGFGPHRTDQLDPPEGTPSAKRAFGLDEGGALPFKDPDVCISAALCRRARPPTELDLLLILVA